MRKILLQYIIPSDLKAFGLIPEIIGRLASFKLYEPFRCKNIKSYFNGAKKFYYKAICKALFNRWMYVEFTIEEDALNYIVEKAVEYKLGARGLRSLV